MAKDYKSWLLENSENMELSKEDSKLIGLNTPVEIKPKNVKIIIKETNHVIDPNRKYHIFDIEENKFCVENLLKEEVARTCRVLKLTVVE